MHLNKEHHIVSTSTLSIKQWLFCDFCCCIFC